MSRRLRHGDDSGITLVELLVAMLLSSVLITVAMSTVVGSQDAVVIAKQQQGLNEEARQAINRMSRDLRQASSVVTALRPNGSPQSTGVVAVRFTADFDGDGCIAVSTATPAPPCLAHQAGNPEDITYCFEANSTKLFVIDNALSTPVTAGDSSCADGLPLLAGNVRDFSVEYRSNLYRHDADGDGITSWKELDASPAVGNQDGVLNVEVDEIDSVVLTITMGLGARKQIYRTQVDLRNRST